MYCMHGEQYITHLQNLESLIQVWYLVCKKYTAIKDHHQVVKNNHERFLLLRKFGLLPIIIVTLLQYYCDSSLSNS